MKKEYPSEDTKIEIAYPPRIPDGIPIECGKHKAKKVG
jgi:hypothetical protein